MEFKHKSVLFDEVMEGLSIKENGIYVDGTLGGGGHSSGICERLSEDGMLIGIDRDKEALKAASKRLEGYGCRKAFVQSNYADVKEVLSNLGIDRIDGAVLDLGVSSYQLDNPERGFSYMHDAKLDMRMNQDDTFTAYDVVNTYSEKDLTDIFYRYGEEKWSARVAKFIVERRKEKPFETTFELVDVIKAAIPKEVRRDGPHPAKRIFQAIRIEVNNELGGLEKAVEDFIEVLAPNGKLGIITFHSLEDRTVKEIFQKHINPCTCPKEFPVCVCGKVPDIKKKSGKPVVPTEKELMENPRSRSAKLRVAEKI
ncbi:MAG: 16S rRNA (cytosine(1402)-N(4))-methyltransferase RsmH [Clostridia bacterium]|nr:16S rRNA (cytosine(1402)-N(4))-methyltransferase RsmH [Clostridia bacterium]